MVCARRTSLPRGHAIECRIYAEDPGAAVPAQPRDASSHLREPQGPGVRVDSGIAAGYDVPLHYDPLLAKLSAWGSDREAARRRLLAALREYVVLGVTTNIPFLLDLLAHPAFAAGATHTHFIAEHMPDGSPAARAARRSPRSPPRCTRALAPARRRRAGRADARAVAVADARRVAAREAGGR